jgi:hypothetical protein
MNRTALYVLFAGLLSLAGPATARADLTLVTTPFSGTITDYTQVFNVPALPYTDSFGRTVNESGLNGSNIDGILSIVPFATTFGLSFTGLATGTTQAGISLDAFSVFASQFLTSATVSNGDSFTVTSPIMNSAFIGFTDTTPFTSITFNFTTPNPNFESFNIDDFRTATAAVAVPEPSTLFTSGSFFAVLAAAAAWRRRRARLGERVR